MNPKAGSPTVVRPAFPLHKAPLPSGTTGNPSPGPTHSSVDITQAHRSSYINAAGKRCGPSLYREPTEILRWHPQLGRVHANGEENFAITEAWLWLRRVTKTPLEFPSSPSHRKREIFRSIEEITY